MKTYSAKPTDISRKWYVVDASELPLGRLATRVAELLIGKGKPIFTRHVDVGDFVIVINSDKVVTTGKKLDQKIYHRHSKYPGGLTSLTLKEKLGKDSTEVVRHAVRGMLPVNKLRQERLNRLKVYIGTEHGHAAQKPELISFKENK